MIERLIYLLGYLAGQIERWQRKRKEREAQKARDELAEDYRAWYEHHFGGLPDDDADETDETNSDAR